MDTFKITVDGIPALAVMTHFIHAPAQGMRAASDVDCYGYTDMEYDLKDRTGSPQNGDAEWLLKKVNEKNLWGDLEIQILAEMDRI